MKAWDWQQLSFWVTSFRFIRSQGMMLDEIFFSQHKSRMHRFLCQTQTQKSWWTNSPCFIITVRKRTMTLEQGLMRTWRFPRFSALLMLFSASARTFMRTMMPEEKESMRFISHMVNISITQPHLISVTSQALLQSQVKIDKAAV